jgi:hypothetical protein
MKEKRVRLDGLTRFFMFALEGLCTALIRYFMPRSLAPLSLSKDDRGFYLSGPRGMPLANVIYGFL